VYATYTIYRVRCTRLSDDGLAGWMCAAFISAWECTWNGTYTALVHFCSHFLVLICPQRSPGIHQEQTKRQKWCKKHSRCTESIRQMQGTRVLQVGHHIIMADRMAHSDALRPDVTTTVADYGDEQVNQEQTTGAGYKGVASGTPYHNGIQDGSIRCTTTRCNSHSSRLWRRAGEPRTDNVCRAQGCCKWDTIS
jgi:hypothetical protein